MIRLAQERLTYIKEAQATAQATIDQQGLLILDFQDQKQLLTYRLSAAGLDLISARDYTIETGIGIHAQEIAKQRRAAGMEDLIVQAIKAEQYEGAFKLLEMAFDWNPWLVDDWARERKIKKLEDHDSERWLKLITATQEEAKRRDEEREKMMEAAKARAEARAERGGR